MLVQRRWLQLVKQRLPRVLVVQLGQLAHDLAAALVVEVRHRHFDSHNLVAALLGPLRVLHAALPHAQLLPALRAGRNLQLRAPVNGGHVHLGSQRSLGDCHRNGQMDVVAHASENGVRAGADDEVEIAGSAAVRPGVTLALQTDALPVARPRLDAKLNGLRAADHALAMAGRAVIGDAACTVAFGAGNVELHAPAHLRHLPCAVALRALHRSAGRGLSVAGGTNLLAAHLQPRLSAADSRPEVHRSLIFQIRPRLRTARPLRLLRPAEDAGKNVLEAAPASRICRRMLAPALPRSALKAGEVEAAEIHRTAMARALPRISLGLRRIDLVRVEAQLVVYLALLFVAQHVVGLGDLLDLLLGPLIAGVHIRVISPRSLAEGLADLLRRCRLLHAERAVIILIRGRGHSLFGLVSSLRVHVRFPISGNREVTNFNRYSIRQPLFAPRPQQRYALPAVESPHESRFPPHPPPIPDRNPSASASRTQPTC